MVKKEELKMKKNLLKFLPLISAVLLATSCSKDDENVQTQNPASQPQTQSTIPFSIRVNTGKPLTKIGYAEDNANPGYYNLTFTDDDVANGLTLVIKEGGNELGGLKLQKDKEIFMGEIDQPSSDQAKLTAEITVGGTVSSVTTKITDLFASCKHTFKSETFTPDAEEITLTDQNAYLAVSLPAEETLVSVNGEEYAVANGNVWIAFDASQPVQSARLSLFNKQAEPGKIYTVTREKSKFEAKSFTVAADDGTGKPKKVVFSPGNLLYQASSSDKKWEFAARQYDYVGNAAGNTTQNELDDEGNITVNHRANNVAYIDLFGWGTWLSAGGQQPYETQYAAATKYTWSGNSVIDDEWFTLSHEEWAYLFNSRGEGKYGEGTVADVHGVILLPDDWTYPTDLSSSSTSKDNFTSGSSAWSNSYTADDWVKMEANGAVFLPAAGYRVGTAVGGVGDGGGYWSSSADGSDGAWSLGFDSGYVGSDDDSYRFYGQSVRLVRRL